MRLLATSLAALAVAACSGADSTSVGTPTVQFGVAPYAAIDLTGAPVEGPADAWVTIVEFLDYSCPFCADMYPLIEDLHVAYPDDVRVAIKVFPLPGHGDPAIRAARAALCANRQGEFWELHAALFAHAPAFSDDQVTSYAAGVAGMDLGAWMACYASPASLDAVNADVQLGKDLFVPGTPTFFMNGKELPADGVYSLGTMNRLVLRAQAAAEASGVPRDRYYDKVILGLP